MHVLCTSGRDETRGVAQLWVTGRIEYATLQMRKFKTFTIKAYITDDDRATPQTGLKRYGNLGDQWSTNAIEPVIAISAKPDFVEAMVDIMPDDDSKTAVLRILEDDKFPFTYDVRDHITEPGEFPNPGADSKVPRHGSGQVVSVRSQRYYLFRTSDNPVAKFGPHRCRKKSRKFSTTVQRGLNQTSSLASCSIMYTFRDSVTNARTEAEQA